MPHRLRDSTDRLLVCHLCGRVLRCTEPELIEYTATGWPSCCGETMTLFVESHRPDTAPPPPQAPDDTAVGP